MRLTLDYRIGVDGRLSGTVTTPDGRGAQFTGLLELLRLVELAPTHETTRVSSVEPARR